MFPPQQSISLNIQALSGITGSISIAAWVVVFSPQIIENFRRHSADGLSVVFLVIWLAGDVFNILGAVLQGVLPTMVILAVYYTIADIVLLAQVFWYRGFTLKDEVSPTNGSAVRDDAERRPLLSGRDNNTLNPNTTSRQPDGHPVHHRRSSSLSETLRTHLVNVDGTHLSPATPLLDNPKPNDPKSAPVLSPMNTLQTILFNTFAILLVCLAGVAGWYISDGYTHLSRHHHESDDNQPKNESSLHFDPLGQTFGYLCAALYLGSRVPQLLLNYRRKSTEGVSLLFFLFACIGNLTYNISIFAFDPTPYCNKGGVMDPSQHCAEGETSEIYKRYVAVNASWILGSLGTLALDMGIFAQFFIYSRDSDDSDDSSDNTSESDDWEGEILAAVTTDAEDDTEGNKQFTTNNTFEHSNGNVSTKYTNSATTTSNSAWNTSSSTKKATSEQHGNTSSSTSEYTSSSSTNKRSTHQNSSSNSNSSRDTNHTRQHNQKSSFSTSESNSNMTSNNHTKSPTTSKSKNQSHENNATMLESGSESQATTTTTKGTATGIGTTTGDVAGRAISA